MGTTTLGLVALAGVLTSLVVTAGATVVAALRTGRSRWTWSCAVGVLMTLALSVQDDPEKSARTMLGLALERAHELSIDDATRNVNPQSAQRRIPRPGAGRARDATAKPRETRHE